MHLYSALQQLAERYGLDADALIASAEEDTHTGWDRGEGEWPTGSLWRVEGQVLYALIRALQPATVLELGTWYGCSATHMLQALEVNGNGVLVGVDNHMQGGPAVIGDRIPEPLRERFHHVNQHILDYVTTTDDRYDLIFEDGMHDRAQVAAVWTAGQHALNPGGVMISHDATHYVVGNDVRAGIEQAGITDALFLSIDPADCGLAVWRKPGERVYHGAFETGAELVLEEIVEPKPTPKPRKSRSKKA